VAIAGAFGDGNQFTGAAYVFPGLTSDCNANGFVDYCDIADGVSVDSDGNYVLDQCESAAPGDFNADGDVNLTDYRAFADCAAGPGTQLDQTAPYCLNAFDFDFDGDNDLADFSNLQALIR